MRLFAICFHVKQTDFVFHSLREDFLSVPERELERLVLHTLPWRIGRTEGDGVALSWDRAASHLQLRSRSFGGDSSHHLSHNVPNSPTHTHRAGRDLQDQVYEPHRLMDVVAGCKPVRLVVVSIRAGKLDFQWRCIVVNFNWSRLKSSRKSGQADFQNPTQM